MSDWRSDVCSSDLVAPFHRAVAQGRWSEAAQFCFFDFPSFNLKGRVLGVIGDGVLGKAVAKIGEAFGMEVRFSAYKGVAGMGPLYTPFETIIAESDVITLHCPLTPATRNLIGPAEFAAMKKRPLIRSEEQTSELQSLMRISYAV